MPYRRFSNISEVNNVNNQLQYYNDVVYCFNFSPGCEKWSSPWCSESRPKVTMWIFFVSGQTLNYPFWSWQAYIDMIFFRARILYDNFSRENASLSKVQPFFASCNVTNVRMSRVTKLKRCWVPSSGRLTSEDVNNFLLKFASCL